MTDHEARTLAKLKLIRDCCILQVHEDEWEISLYGHESIDPEDCVVARFGNALMREDLTDTEYFLSIDEALHHVVELGIRCQIRLHPLWPEEIESTH